MAADSPTLSPLHEQHVAAGAKFSEFGGWNMPLEYPTGTLREHQAVREDVGIFDVSHLGKISVTGPGALTLLNRTFTNDLRRISAGQAQYTLCCEPTTGGVIDDLIVYRYGDEAFFLIPNAANAASIVQVLREEASQGAGDVEITDLHERFAVLAVQGPGSDDVLTDIGLPVGHDYMAFTQATWRDTPITVCRTGYTGERGYELVVPAAQAPLVWQALLDSPRDVVACGLGARDTLRTEMGYALHGQDISLEITPGEAGLSWAVGWAKEDFRGRATLVQQRAEGPRRRLVGLRAVARGIPRPGMSVRMTPDMPLGLITSGTFSPSLKVGIGLALIAAQISDGSEVLVDIRGRHEVFEVVKPPFVPSSVRD